MRHVTFRPILGIVSLFVLLAASTGMVAQDTYPPSTYPDQYPAQSYPGSAPTYPAQTYPAQSYPDMQRMPPGQAPAAPAQQTQQPLLAPEQLNNLVAPVALYPDPLLGQILVAATYPLEIVEASQWLQQNRGLRGTQLTEAAKQQPWDPSIQALVAFPDVMARLTQDIRWTTDLGNAFLAQQADVMNAVQAMRARARNNGQLNSNAQQTVTTPIENGQQAIEIQPANPDVIYVPTYNPVYVYGPPVYGYYPPLWYPSYAWGWGSPIDIGFWFGSGWGGWGFGFGWGWGFGWFHHSVYCNPYFFHHFGFRGDWGRFSGRQVWAHDAFHRGGIAYPNHQLASRFNATSVAAARSNYARSAGVHSFNNSSQGFARGFQGGAQHGVANNFQGGHNFATPRNYSAPNNYSAPRSYSAPRNYSAPSYSAPRSYSAPQQQFHSAPRASAPSFGGGGGFHSAPAPAYHGGGGGGGFHGGGGGGGGSHSSGGGGGHSGGGGHHR